MQRRAAAIYFAFFLVVGAGAYAFIGVAEDTSEPQYSLSGPVAENGTSTTIDGTTYDVVVEHFRGDTNATLTWTNESTVFTASLDNGSTATIQNQSYLVSIPNESGVSSFSLVAEQNVSQLLADDPDVQDEPATIGDTDHVVFNNGTVGPPVSEYFPAPETREVAEGDELAYEGNTTTVSAVEPSAVTLRWTNAAQESVEMTEGSNVSLASGQYFAHFPDETSIQVVPSNEFAQYNATSQERSAFNERVAGLWGIVILAGFAAAILLSAAYMPVRG